MDQSCISLVSFSLDQQRFAFPLVQTMRVTRMVEITPLPDAPAMLPGFINLKGRLLPVYNPRPRLHLPAREVSPDMYLLIMEDSAQRVAVMVDSVEGLLPGAWVEPPPPELPGLASAFVTGVINSEDGMILALSLDTVLSDCATANFLAPSGAAHDG
jgi:purine-binding chemotaxis protein CheW